MRVEWIAVDWGTSRLRVWAMAGDAPVAEAASDRGMNALDRSGFEPALLDLVGDWLADGRTTPVLACGMVGSRQGWAEAPYRRVPCTPAPEAPAPAPAADSRLDVRVLPGLSQAAPPDVMRGEETQIAGFLSQNSGWDGVICLPGTHTKWAHISAGEVVSFQTVMTGELFALLSTRSVLRHSVDAGSDQPVDREAFLDGLTETLSRPAALTTHLFRLRAGHLLEGTAPASARARLSGLLVGAELAATRPYWLGRELAVIGAATLADLYVQALGAQGVPATTAAADAMTLAGLTAAYHLLKGGA